MLTFICSEACGVIALLVLIVACVAGVVAVAIAWAALVMWSDAGDSLTGKK